MIMLLLSKHIVIELRCCNKWESGGVQASWTHSGRFTDTKTGSKLRGQLHLLGWICRQQNGLQTPGTAALTLVDLPTAKRALNSETICARRATGIRHLVRTDTHTQTVASYSLQTSRAPATQLKHFVAVEIYSLLFSFSKYNSPLRNALINT